jgi:Putative GTPase activating protein for Arf
MENQRSTHQPSTTTTRQRQNPEERSVVQEIKEQQPRQESGDIDILELASAEIEQMRNNSSSVFHSFPPVCLSMLKRLEGNHRCVDCGEQNPQWAACRYGAMLCLNCSGHHRSLGVQISSVRSISMDEWSVTEVVSMLEGGNCQLGNFFERHNLTKSTCTATSRTTSQQESAAGATTTSAEEPPDGRRITPENVTCLRYKTKAALFYRRQMELHVANILAKGPYRGREISRRNAHHALEKRNSTVD